MRIIASLLFVAFLCQPISAETPDQDPDAEPRSTSVWMQKKMAYAQAILRGLSASDFEAIGSNARHMRLLNKVEGFVRRRDPNYRLQLRTFERICDEMIKHADNENLPGATLAFNQLTISCVSCHETLRNSNGAGSED